MRRLSEYEVYNQTLQRVQEGNLTLTASVWFELCQEAGFAHLGIALDIDRARAEAALTEGSEYYCLLSKVNILNGQVPRLSIRFPAHEQEEYAAINYKTTNWTPWAAPFSNTASLMGLHQHFWEAEAIPLLFNTGNCVIPEIFGQSGLPTNLPPHIRFNLFNSMPNVCVHHVHGLQVFWYTIAYIITTWSVQTTTLVARVVTISRNSLLFSEIIKIPESPTHQFQPIQLESRHIWAILVEQKEVLPLDLRRPKCTWNWGSVLSFNLELQESKNLEVEQQLV